jgi:hypothetical protein
VTIPLVATYRIRVLEEVWACERPSPYIYWWWRHHYRGQFWFIMMDHELANQSLELVDATSPTAS